MLLTSFECLWGRAGLHPVVAWPGYPWWSCCLTAAQQRVVVRWSRESPRLGSKGRHWEEGSRAGGHSVSGPGRRVRGAWGHGLKAQPPAEKHVSWNIIGGWGMRWTARRRRAEGERNQSHWAAWAEVLDTTRARQCSRCEWWGGLPEAGAWGWPLLWNRFPFNIVW